MKRFYAFLTKNWCLKLLALGLAIVLYHTVKQSLAVGGRSLTPFEHEQRPSETQS